MLLLGFCVVSFGIFVKLIDSLLVVMEVDIQINVSVIEVIFIF